MTENITPNELARKYYDSADNSFTGAGLAAAASFGAHAYHNLVNPYTLRARNAALGMGALAAGLYGRGLYKRHKLNQLPSGNVDDPTSNRVDTYKDMATQARNVHGGILLNTALGVTGAYGVGKGIATRNPSQAITGGLLNIASMYGVHKAGEKFDKLENQYREMNPELYYDDEDDTPETKTASIVDLAEQTMYKYYAY